MITKVSMIIFFICVGFVLLKNNGFQLDLITLAGIAALGAAAGLLFGK
jgi:hypothetical protein